MEILIAFLVGGLFAVGVYLMLRPHLIQFLVGFLVVGNAANLLIFAAGRFGSLHPPIVPNGAEAVSAPFANPLPQALILTAIVIGFALAAFGIVLFFRAQQTFGTLSGEEIPETGGDAPVPSLTESPPHESDDEDYHHPKAKAQA